MTNILEFKKKGTPLSEITIEVETQRTDDGIVWMSVRDLKTGEWGEWFRMIDYME